MKSGTKKVIILTLIVLFLSILSCGDPSGGNSSSISITFSNAPGRAVRTDQLRHVITLSGPTGSKTFNIDGSGSVKATLAVGLWTINVQAFLGDELYAVGSGSADVKAGQNTTVMIQMSVVWFEPPTTNTQPPPPPSYYFVTTNADLLTFITLTAKARAVVPDGNYDYTAQLLGVIISSGTATVSNSIFAFLAGDGDTFGYDASTGNVSGLINLTPAKIAEIEAATGMDPALFPSTLNIDYMTGVEIGGGGTYWNGTWVRKSEDGTPLTQQIVFSGASYTLTDGTNTETGTFTYNDSSTAASPYTDNVFIFFRPENKIAVYKWEGMADDPIVSDNNIELFNWTSDPMGIARDDTLLDELADAIADATSTYGPGSPEEILAQAEYDTAWDANPKAFWKQ